MFLLRWMWISFESHFAVCPYHDERWRRNVLEENVFVSFAAAAEPIERTEMRIAAEMSYLLLNRAERFFLHPNSSRSLSLLHSLCFCFIVAYEYISIKRIKFIPINCILTIHTIQMTPSMTSDCNTHCVYSIRAHTHTAGDVAVATTTAATVVVIQ